MKISSRTGQIKDNLVVEGFNVHLEAENQEEAEYLYNFFRGYCKRLSKKYPLKDQNWKP